MTGIMCEHSLNFILSASTRRVEACVHTVSSQQVTGSPLILVQLREQGNITTRQRSTRVLAGKTLPRRNFLQSPAAIRCSDFNHFIAVIVFNEQKLMTMIQCFYARYHSDNKQV